MGRVCRRGGFVAGEGLSRVGFVAGRVCLGWVCRGEGLSGEGLSVYPYYSTPVRKNVFTKE